MQGPVSLKAKTPAPPAKVARRGFRPPFALWPVLPLFVALILAVIVYRLPAQATIPIGSLGDQLVVRSSQSQFAEPYTGGLWYPDEQDRGERYRWSRRTAAITLPAFGAGAGTLELGVAGWPDTPAEHQPTVAVLAGTPAVTLTTFAATGDYQRIRVPLPAATTPDRTIILQTSAVLTATAQHADPRPKGVRVNFLAVTTAGGAGLVPSTAALWPMLLITLLATVVVGRQTRRRVVPVVFGSGVAVALATALSIARLWTVAALPLVAAATVVLSLLAEQHTIRDWLAAWRYRWRAGSALEHGTVLGTLVVIGWLVGVIVQRLTFPSFDMIVEDVEWLVALVPAVMITGVLVLAGPTRIPAWLAAFRQRLIVGRLAAVLLAVFLLIWLGWEYTVLVRLPVVGHADYADNAVVARNLVRGRGWLIEYVTQFYDLRPNGQVSQPQPTWPLLQPVWIAPWMALFGPTALAARLPNLVFNGLLAWLVFRIGADGWDRRVGLLAAILVLINRFFFRLTIYATTDLGFVILSVAALWLFFRANERAVRDQQPRREIDRWRAGAPKDFALAGLAMGLMMLQKPSGAVLGFGMGLWVLGRWIRLRRLPWRGLLVWGFVSVTVLSPYLIRNLQTFGKPVASTESIDAWVLYYNGPTKEAFNAIYNVYFDQGPPQVSDVPNRSWVLRWGWDRTFSKITQQSRAVVKYFLPPNGSLLGLPLTALALAGLFTLSRRQRSLLGLVGLAGLGYGAFLILYWHTDEERYWLLFVPWLVLIAMAAICTLYDRAATLARGKLSGLVGLGLTILVIATLQPHWREISDSLEPSNDDYILGEWQSSLDAFAWLHDHTPADAVIMSRVPWQLSFYADRQSVMVPNEPLPTILGIAKYYKVGYLVVNSTTNFGPEANAALNKLRETPDSTPLGSKVGDFTLVGRFPSTQPGRKPVLVYELPADYAGAGPIKR